MADIFNQPWRLLHTTVRGSGGRELKKFRDISPALDDDSGSESWVGAVNRARHATSENPNMGCAETVLPDGRRMYLFEAIALNPRAALGEKHFRRHGQDLALLVKFLDARFKYPLQAHPTRARAGEVFGSKYGKEECWYVISLREDAPEPPYILAGFAEGITRREMERLYRLEDMPAMEALCHKIPVHPGETFLLRAGVPHALGAGSLVIEIQEPSDITMVPLKQKALSNLPKNYVFLDDAAYEERVLGTFAYDGFSYEENLRRTLIPPAIIREGGWGREWSLIGPAVTPYFSCARLDLNGRTPIRATGFPQIAIVLAGNGVISFEGGSLPVRKGDELFLPYSIPGAALEGEAALVFCHPEGAESPAE
jgi:mannose-6-phosphate isomerase